MPRLMCMTRLNELPLDEPVTVEPMRAFPPIRDLVTDVSWNFRVKPTIASSRRGRRMRRTARGAWQQRDIDRVQEFRKCIECFLCQDVCHVLRDHKLHEDQFIGPRYLLYAAALEMHPLDTADRVPALKNETASATATSRSAARRSAPSTSPSPTTRSSRSRNGPWIGSTIR